jgi:hypothetical protein
VHYPAGGADTSCRPLKRNDVKWSRALNLNGIGIAKVLLDTKRGAIKAQSALWVRNLQCNVR